MVVNAIWIIVFFRFMMYSGTDCLKFIGLFNLTLKVTIKMKNETVNENEIFLVKRFFISSQYMLFHPTVFVIHPTIHFPTTYFFIIQKFELHLNRLNKTYCSCVFCGELYWDLLDKKIWISITNPEFPETSEFSRARRIFLLFFKQLTH